MEKDNWEYIKSFIQTLLLEVKLDRESIEAINHYLEHDEYEMAFEGLFIEIMKLEEVPKIDFVESMKVGRKLKLNEESIFDFEFWKKFETFIKIVGRER